MAVYLREFATQAAYEAAQSSLMLPNVSLIDETNVVEYNPSSPDPRLIAVYNVTSTSSPTQIISEDARSPLFSAIEIDGVAQPSVVSAYTFSTTGEHTVKYTLTDPTTIGYSAFRDCTSLTSIGENAFGGTPWWDSYSADTSHHYGNIIYINDVAYKATSESITSATFKSGTVSIGSYAFYDCDGLTNIVIPDGVTTIGNGAFQECNNLTSVTIGNSVTSIGYSAFESCYSLTSIDIPNSVTSIGDSAFLNCSSLTTCTIGSGVTSIGYSAFQNCGSLTSVVIPNSVTSIGYSAFESCSGLTSIVSNAMTAPTIEDSTFYVEK